MSILEEDEGICGCGPASPGVVELAVACSGERGIFAHDNAVLLSPFKAIPGLGGKVLCLIVSN